MNFEMGGAVFRVGAALEAAAHYVHACGGPFSANDQR